MDSETKKAVLFFLRGLSRLALDTASILDGAEGLEQTRIFSAPTPETDAVMAPEWPSGKREWRLDEDGKVRAKYASTYASYAEAAHIGRFEGDGEEEERVVWLTREEYNLLSAARQEHTLKTWRRECAKRRG